MKMPMMKKANTAPILQLFLHIQYLWWRQQNRVRKLWLSKGSRFVAFNCLITFSHIFICEITVLQQSAWKWSDFQCNLKTYNLWKSFLVYLFLEGVVLVLFFTRSFQWHLILILCVYLLTYKKCPQLLRIFLKVSYAINFNFSFFLYSPGLLDIC